VTPVAATVVGGGDGPGEGSGNVGDEQVVAVADDLAAAGDDRGDA
jgi:hypothetical protein